MGNYKQILKNLKNDVYDDRTCYAEAMNAIVEIDIEDYKDPKAIKNILNGFNKYFDNCTCNDEPVNRVMRNFYLLDEKQKNKYISFFEQVDSTFSTEFTKNLSGEPCIYDQENLMTNSKPFSNIVINDIVSSFTKTDGSFLEDVFEDDNATLLKAYIDEDPEVLYMSNDTIGSLIHFAAYNNSVQILEMLNEYVKHYDGVNQNGLTPLHIAFSRGNIEAIDFLIEHGANINIKTPEGGLTPKNIATLAADAGSVRKLIDNNYIDVQDLLQQEILMEAVQGFRNGGVIYLLEENIIKPDYVLVNQTKEAKEAKLLHAAIVLGNQELVTYFYNKGIDLFSCEREAPNWVYALQTGDETIIQYFINDERLDNLTEEQIDDMMAFAITNPKIFGLCKKKYPSYKNHLKSVYEIIINEGLFESFNYLIDSNEEINVQVAGYHSVLSYATNMNSEDLINRIMTKETVDYSNTIKAPFVFFLARNLMFDLIDKAIDLGADYSLAPEGASLLYQTIYQNPDVSQVKRIYKLDDRVTREGDNGYTPLIVATMHGNYDTVEFLLEKGANPKYKSKGLKISAMDLAKKNKRKDIIKLFKKHK